MDTENLSARPTRPGPTRARACRSACPPGAPAFAPGALPQVPAIDARVAATAGVVPLPRRVLAGLVVGALLAGGCGSGPPRGTARDPVPAGPVVAAPPVPGPPVPGPPMPGTQMPGTQMPGTRIPGRPPEGRDGTPGGAGTPLRPGPRGGAFYKDDGPGDSVPGNLDQIPEPDPRREPLHRFANRPYSVFGREYVPGTALRPYRERGLASWYGRKFHGQRTSVGEVYDMYALTAAHPTLPLPSYARVTSTRTGHSLIVRVNDRGPFHPGRIIDLSYTAAHRLGILQSGSGEVEVESILFGMEDLLDPLPAVASVEAKPASLAVGAERGGFAVQLGAFANFANAENFRAHLANQLQATGVETRIRQQEGLYRVSAGPFPDAASARAAGERIRDRAGIEGAIRAQ